MQYFAQDEATRMDPAPTVYETLASGSPLQMVPMIRNILGGFLFSGDDVYKHVRVLSGGERTRLAVARMLLRPSNTLLLDEPTNHLDLDSKEVLLDALVDYGGTLIFVSHDRYFVERLATKIIEIGSGVANVYPGTYTEFLWSKEHRDAPAPARKPEPKPRVQEAPKAPAAAATKAPAARQASGDREARKRADAERRKQQRERESLQRRISELEARIADRENQVKEIEASMSAPGFYEDAAASSAAISRHQSLMWEVGDLMAQWEALQEHAGGTAPES
jgi:ATP-binding cassette subfamily F protein 3